MLRETGKRFLFPGEYHLNVVNLSNSNSLTEMAEINPKLYWITIMAKLLRCDEAIHTHYYVVDEFSAPRTVCRTRSPWRNCT